MLPHLYTTPNVFMELLFPQHPATKSQSASKTAPSPDRSFLSQGPDTQGCSQWGTFPSLPQSDMLYIYLIPNPS